MKDIKRTLYPPFLEFIPFFYIYGTRGFSLALLHLISNKQDVLMTPMIKKSLLKAETWAEGCKNKLIRLNKLKEWD